MYVRPSGQMLPPSVEEVNAMLLPPPPPPLPFLSTTVRSFFTLPAGIDVAAPLPLPFRFDPRPSVRLDAD